MPGIPSHILMVDETASTLSPTSDSELYAILNLHPEMVRLGAVGPDLTFFAPDFGDWSVELVRIVAEFYDEAIAPIVELYEKWVEPVLDALNELEEGVETVLDQATCDLVSTLLDGVDGVTNRVGAVVQSGLLNIVAKSVNIFDHMGPRIQFGETEEDWFWFDTLHNRRTDRFIAEMWTRADTDAKKAYVLGYTSHHAGDFIGHQFVNTVVGSPARARLQRHHFAENIIDVRLYDVLRSGEIAGSKIHLLLPHGQDVEEAGSLRVILDNPNEVPADMRPIFRMIADAMEATFSGAPHPQRIASEYLTVENLNTAFWLLLVAMKASTSNFIPPPVFPGAEVLDAATDAMEEFLETASNPPAPSFSAPDVCFALWDDDCDFSLAALEEWAEYLADAINYLGELLGWLAELIMDLWQVFACTITLPIKLTLQAAFWLLHEALHALLTYLRESLVLAALLHPEVGWIDSNPIAQSFLRVSRQQIAEAAEGRYPHRAAETNAGFHSYPTTPTEDPPTRPSGFPVGTAATQFIDAFAVISQLMAAFAGAPDPAASRDTADLNASVPIGSVVPLTTWIMRSLISNDTSVLSDWSLDSDRGYAYLNWRIAPGSEGSVKWDSTDIVDHDWSG